MGKEEMICDSCGKSIENEEDAIITKKYFDDDDDEYKEIVHEDCFNSIKEIKQLRQIIANATIYVGSWKAHPTKSLQILSEHFIGDKTTRSEKETLTTKLDNLMKILEGKE